MPEKVTVKVGTQDLHIETGRLAKQADGSVTVQVGDTIVVVAAVAAVGAKEGQDFFPLTVDYREKAAAVGRFPGGYFKREGRPAGRGNPHLPHDRPAHSAALPEGVVQ